MKHYALKVFTLLALAGSLAAQPVNIKITADNNFAVYDGTASAAITRHFVGAWPAVQAPPPLPIPSTSNWMYVVAWDDGRVFNGLLAQLGSSTGYVTTSSPLWQVCATKKKLANNPALAPSAPVLTFDIISCNNANGWHATSNGPANVNSPANNLWAKVNAIDDTAGWIWDRDTSAACAGVNGFLQGACDPGEFLIFRIPLEKVRRCLPPVPDFSVDFSGGWGTFTTNGANSQNETSHFWSIQESDASWNRFGPEITEWFVNQPAGSFNIKQWAEAKGLKLKCNTYYRVKLAVSNACVNWREVTKLVKLNCCSEVSGGGSPATLPSSPVPLPEK